MEKMLGMDLGDLIGVCSVMPEKLITYEELIHAIYIFKFAVTSSFWIDKILTEKINGGNIYIDMLLTAMSSIALAIKFRRICPLLSDIEECFYNNYNDNIGHESFCETEMKIISAFFEKRAPMLPPKEYFEFKSKFYLCWEISKNAA